MRQATESLEAAGSPARIQPGALIGGRFRIEAAVAQEAGTSVYRVEDTQAGGQWSLRVIPLGVIAQDPDRLSIEVQRTQAIRHKNLVEVEAVGRENDFVFVVTELVDGQSLRQFIDGKRAEGRGISLKGASNLVAHVSNGLEYARRVTLHGALSPATVWVNRAGRVKVGSLGLGSSVPGLARLGAPEGFAETVYMAPELAAGAPATVASDVFSLGVILYELLTGHPPRAAFQSVSTVVAGIPPGVDAVVECALAREAGRRWPSTGAFKEALQAAAGTAPEPARNPAATATATATANARPIPAGGTESAQLFASASGGGLSAAPRTPAPRAPAAPSPRPAQSPISAQQLPAAQPEPPTPGEARPQSPAGGVAVGPDDLVERWLIQKDKLDFGPFAMVQIRAQVERGDILAEHVIVDNESGARCRVREYPGLGLLVKSAHRRLEQARRAQAEHQSQKSEKKKSVVTTLIVSVVVAVVLAGVGFYVLSRRDSDSGHLATREEEAEIETFLKGVKIGGLKATVRHAAHHGASASSASGGPADEFNNDTSFGDVSKATAEGDQTLDDDQIQNTMMANYRKLIPCIVHTGVSEIAMEFVVRGSGKVSAVKVNGQRAGALPACILGRMQSFSFPHFNGSKTIASWSMSMGR